MFKKTIIDNGINLPAFLFYSDTKSSNKTSPSASFDPASAISGGNAWQGTSSPSQELRKKTLILTESAFAPFSLARSIPLITKLKSIGFDIFLCCQEPHKSEKFLVGVGEDNRHC